MKHLLISLDQHQLLMVANEKQTSMNSAPIAIGKVHFSMIHWINWTRSTYQHRTFSWLFVYTQLWMGKKSFCSPLIERALPRTRRNLHTKWMSTGKKGLFMALIAITDMIFLLWVGGRWISFIYASTEAGSIVAYSTPTTIEKIFISA